MTSPEPRTGKKPDRNPAIGCGCLIVIALLVGGIAVSCLGGSDEPAGQPPASAPPTTSTSSPPVTDAAPPSTSSQVPPAPARPAVVRECAEFGSQAEAQAALLPGDPEQLDPDNDGLACDNYFARKNRPDPTVRAPRPTADDDDRDSDSGGTRPHSGNSGHPCGPGERDGDNDGYCGEG